MNERELPGGLVDRLPWPTVKLSMNSAMPDGLDCHYCPDAATTRDHVVAKARGGVNLWWNLVPACKRCNGRKGARADRICPCPFCDRARLLFQRGWRRTPAGSATTSLFAVKAPSLPIDLSIEAYEASRGFGPTPHHDGLPRSFDGSV